MRYIRIPDDIQILGPKGEPRDVLSFAQWMERVILLDRAWSNAQKLLMAADLLGRVRVAVDVWEVSEAEWAAIKAVVENPTDGYNPPIAIQTVAFIKAVFDAKDKKLEVSQSAVS